MHSLFLICPRLATVGVDYHNLVTYHWFYSGEERFYVFGCQAVDSHPDELLTVNDGPDRITEPLTMHCVGAILKDSARNFALSVLISGDR